MRILKGLSILLLYENCYGKDFQNTPTALKVQETAKALTELGSSPAGSSRISLAPTELPSSCQDGRVLSDVTIYGYLVPASSMRKACE